MFTIKALIAIVIAVAGVVASSSRPAAADGAPVSPQAQNLPHASIGSVLQAMRH
jgi:hypothetical protein